MHDAANADGGGITPGAYRRMFALEDSHWWFDGMEAISARLLDGWTAPAAPRVLDAGCGTGRNLRFLGERYGPDPPVGLDHSDVALGCCATRGAAGRLVCGSVNDLPFADHSFDLVTSFDVLMTAGVDDRAALREFARVLRPGGALLLRVPAYDALRGRHDREWAVARRYGRAGLRAKLVAAGFPASGLKLSHANAWLLPVAVAKRLLERLRPPRGDSDLSLGAGRTSFVGRLLRAALASEAPLVARRPGGLPAGLSLVALARR